MRHTPAVEKPVGPIIHGGAAFLPAQPLLFQPFVHFHRARKPACPAEPGDKGNDDVFVQKNRFCRRLKIIFKSIKMQFYIRIGLCRQPLHFQEKTGIAIRSRCRQVRTLQPGGQAYAVGNWAVPIETAGTTASIETVIFLYITNRKVLVIKSFSPDFLRLDDLPITKNNMRMLRYFKALSFQSCKNVSFLHNVSTYHKSPQLSHIVCVCPA